VPAVTFDDLKEQIDRMANGANNILSSEPVSLFEPTSGSTNAVKLIPYTHELRLQFERGIYPWIFSLFNSRPELLAGKSYWSISPGLKTENRTRAGIKVGFEKDTAYLGKKGRLAESIQAVPSSVREIHEMESFRYATLYFLLKEPGLTFISVWNPSFLTILLNNLPNFWTRLIADIHDGSLSFLSERKTPIPESIGKDLSPDPERADTLEKTGPEDLRSIWPSLNLISCWTSGYADKPAETLGGLLPWVEIQGKGLVATEAFVSLPFDGLELLAVRSHFFEFESENGKCQLAHELKKGERYSVLVTTGGGLYRYKLMDRVEVTGYRGSTPALKFIGKESKVVDISGEKMNEDFVSDSLREIFEELSLEPYFAMLAPDIRNEQQGYSLFIECEGSISTVLQKLLEEALRRNPHYDYCRRLGQLDDSRVFQISGGSEEAYLRFYSAKNVQCGGVKFTPLSIETGWDRVFSGKYLLPPD